MSEIDIQVERGARTVAMILYNTLDLLEQASDIAGPEHDRPTIVLETNLLIGGQVTRFLAKYLRGASVGELHTLIEQETGYTYSGERAD